MPFAFSDASVRSLPVFLVEEKDAAAFVAARSLSEKNWLNAAGFSGALKQICVLPGPDGKPIGAVVGYGSALARKRGRFHLAEAAAILPDADWHVEGSLSARDADEAALAWLLASYRFDRYKAGRAPKARLKAPAGIDADRLLAIAKAEAVTRDLINTPASDMGPDELETAVQSLAKRFGAKLRVVRGEELLDKGFPLIHAVGRASTRPPRLLDLRWGKSGPQLTLVGKGVCFDTGGLDLKPAASMGLMKKDMGGAATVIGLAQMIMSVGQKFRLRVLIPAVENAVSGNAFRPQDILTSRKGLTVEINNTDAEGRLVLADALALADEEKPDMIISMATLTGAARVAVGPDLAPFYCDDDAIAATLAEAGGLVADPVWRMPFWDPYEANIEPGIADLDNAPSGGMAGSITAALFLRRFVTNTPRYAHFDIYGWQPQAAPARPKGGVGQGARALLEALPRMLTS
ncbi:MAG: leucyl aminopeptidase family protein [Albidovulum sp.]